MQEGIQSDMYESRSKVLPAGLSLRMVAVLLYVEIRSLSGVVEKDEVDEER